MQFELSANDHWICDRLNRFFPGDYPINTSFHASGEQALSECVQQCPIEARSPLDVPLPLWQNAALFTQ